MEYRRLGHTALNVSALCLGTMTWGEQNTAQEAFEQMDAAIAAGINFFDVAELYPVPPRAETYGRTESILGQWFQERKNRDQVVLATKVVGRSDNYGALDYMRPGANGAQVCLNRANITQALEQSLSRLHTDYIDLYQLHWPDRATNFFGRLGYAHQEKDSIALAETLDVLADFVKAGKIRYLGLSNETPWGVLECLRLHEQHGLPRIVSVQNPYNLLNRSYEVGLAEISMRERVGLLAYSPLAFGMLTGKYDGDTRPERARLTLFSHFKRYLTPRAVTAATAYNALAREFGLSPAQLALQFVTQQPFVTSNIIGATTMEQLRENIDSLAVPLKGELLERVEAIHAGNPNPAP
jgi:aryl-alcohol dehydrogenase-like predicted oxidoreductase